MNHASLLSSNVKSLIMLALLLLAGCATTTEFEKMIAHLQEHSAEIDSRVNRAFSEFNEHNKFNEDIRIGGFTFTQFGDTQQTNTVSSGSSCYLPVRFKLDGKDRQTEKLVSDYVNNNLEGIRNIINQELSDYFVDNGFSHTLSINTFAIYSRQAALGWDGPYCCQTCKDRGPCAPPGSPHRTCCEIACGCCSK